jgi:YD repeat-containing protein
MRTETMSRFFPAAAFAVGMFFASHLHALDVERPKVQTIDKFKVNVATGQVSQGLETVSIGGAMGLSHSISIEANELKFLHGFGYADKFWAETRVVQLSTTPGYRIPTVFRLTDYADSADFRVLSQGQYVSSFYNLPPPYTYVPVGDERHSLVSNNTELAWTKPDGTVVKFQRAANASAGATGLMREIAYPNGFTISIDALGLQGVRTNTGFQLKYLYEADHRPLDKPENPNLTQAPSPNQSSFQSGWSNRNPRYIKAINNAVEYCAPAAVTCSLTNTWPTVTFGWPAASPRTFYLGDTQSTVTLPSGAVAKFDFRAYDLAYNGTNVIPPYVPGREFSPRLIRVTPPGSDQPHYTYDYKNLFISQSSSLGGTWTMRAQTAGVITGATHINKSIGYTTMTPYQGGAYFNSGLGGGINRILMSPNSAQGNPDLISYAETEDGVVYFESSLRNFPFRFVKLTGPTEAYEYNRGNLWKVNVPINGAYRARIEYGYPGSCNAQNRSICNQPTSRRDANGNVTRFRYHAQSGQIEAITSPPNKVGFVAQTRYEYAQKRARFFNGGSSKVEGTPIWLKLAERYCINSNFTGTACSANDEVVTRFEYDHDNLLLSGMTVTDPGGAVRRTCYEYDIYGNQIGASQPKASLSACQ